MNKELISKVISYNYNEFGKEFGDCIVDMKKEIERLEKENTILRQNSQYLVKQQDELEEELEELNKENEKLKKGLNKLLQLNNYMVNSPSGRVISKLIVKQRDLIYELLEGRPRGIMHGSKGVDKE